VQPSFELAHCLLSHCCLTIVVGPRRYEFFKDQPALLRTKMEVGLLKCLSLARCTN